jgi:hypothetical protein
MEGERKRPKKAHNEKALTTLTEAQKSGGP